MCDLSSIFLLSFRLRDTTGDLHDIIAYLPNKVQISAVTVAALWKDLKKYDVL